MKAVKVNCLLASMLQTQTLTVIEILIVLIRLIILILTVVASYELIAETELP